MTFLDGKQWRENSYSSFMVKQLSIIYGLSSFSKYIVDRNAWMIASHTRNLNFLTFAGECPQLRHQKLERGKAKDTYEVHNK